LVRHSPVSVNLAPTKAPHPALLPAPKGGTLGADAQAHGVGRPTLPMVSSSSTRVPEAPMPRGCYQYRTGEGHGRRVEGHGAPCNSAHKRTSTLVSTTRPEARSSNSCSRRAVARKSLISGQCMANAFSEKRTSKKTKRRTCRSPRSMRVAGSELKRLGAASKKREHDHASGVQRVPSVDDNEIVEHGAIVCAQAVH